jgi:hypothetical protein
LHRRMDSAWLVCRRGHRRYWHDWASAYAIAVDPYPGDENAVLAAWLHILTDEYCSANPWFRKDLELLAKSDVKKRRRKKRKKPKIELIHSEFKKLIEEVEKLAEIQRLRKLLIS